MRARPQGREYQDFPANLESCKTRGKIYSSTFCCLRAHLLFPCRLHLLQPVRGLRHKAVPFASASESGSGTQMDRFVKKMSIVPKQMSSVGANLDHVVMLVQDLTRYLHEKAGDDLQKSSKAWSKDYAEHTNDGPLKSSSKLSPRKPTLSRTQTSKPPALFRTKTVSVNRKKQYLDDDD